LLKRQAEEVRDLLPELYLHGLASREGAPLSASSLQRLKEKWQGEYEQWKSAPIKRSGRAYLWADGIYAKARLGKEKAALLVVIGVQRDGSKRFLALEPGIAGSRESCAVKSARLFVDDGNLGLWARLGEVYPQAQEQLCWNHKLLNVMDAVSHKEQAQAKLHLAAMMLWRQPGGGVEGTKEIRASVSAQSQSGQDGGGELGEADDSA
jgi:putative transposase